MTGLALLDRMARYATSGDSAVKPGLERISALLSALGHPERAYPVVHVAGSNGKGSTASFVASIATAAGLRTGLHTSPHLVSVAERMRIGGVPVDIHWLDDFLIRHEDLLTGVGASYFEATVAASLAWFREEQVELAVVEVGLGGRWDATNAVDPSVCVITHLALEHTAILGDTLEAIAAEKAGIVKPGVPTVVAPAPSGVMAVIRDTCLQRVAPLFVAGRHARWIGDELVTPLRSYRRLKPGLSGPHQHENAMLAVLACECLRLTSLSERHVQSGLRNVVRNSGLRGRYEVLSQRPFVVMDVAHNADALVPVLKRFEQETAGLDDRWVVFGIMADKDLADVYARLLPFRIGLVESGTRGRPLEELRADLEAAGADVMWTAAASEAGARLKTLSGTGAVLVTGSHMVVGPVLSEMEG